jgi:hypothetical protein
MTFCNKCILIAVYAVSSGTHQLELAAAILLESLLFLLLCFT